MKRLVQRGVTLLELLVVLVIISILSTVAVGIYGKEVLRGTEQFCAFLKRKIAVLKRVGPIHWMEHRLARGGGPRGRFGCDHLKHFADLFGHLLGLKKPLADYVPKIPGTGVLDKIKDFFGDLF